jgi:hypothetical protein
MAKTAARKKPAAKKASPNKTMEKLLADVQQLIKDQKAIDRRIASLNKRYAKTDPKKDQAAAKKIEKASTELHYLNERANLFSAIAGGDQWDYVAKQIKRALHLHRNDEMSAELAMIYDELGYDRDDFTQQDLDDWIQLGKYRTEGLMSYRQEQWVATTQWHFMDIFDTMNIEQPYPDASENAYW